MKRLGAFLAIYLCWGGTFLAIRWLVSEVPPLLTVAIRCAGGAATLFLWLAWRKTSERVSAAEWRTAFISGCFLFLGCHGLIAWAEQRVPSGEAALLLTSIPLWMVSIDAIRKRCWPSRRVMLGMGLGVAGVAVLSLGEGGGEGTLLDRVLLVVSGLCWAIGSLIGRDGARPQSAARATAMQLTGGAVALLVISLALGEWGAWDPTAISGRAVLSMTFLILGGTVLEFGAYTWLLRVASPSAVGSYAFVNPVVALLLAYLAGDGAIHSRDFLAIGLVLVAVVLTSAAGRQRSPTRGAVRHNS